MMTVLCTLLLLALIALERINKETTKLLRKLDMVSIEVSSTSNVAQTAKERLRKDILEAQDQTIKGVLTALRRRTQGKPTDPAIEALTRDVQQLSASSKKAEQHLTEKLDDVINRLEISTEYQYLQVTGRCSALLRCNSLAWRTGSTCGLVVALPH